MSKKLIKLRNRIIVSLIIFITGKILPLGVYSVLFDIAAYLMVGYDVILRSIKNIGHGQVFDENFLMTLATFGAFYTKEYPEAVMVMWLYQVGELFQGYAVGKSRDSISSLMAIRPDYANIMEDGELVETDPEDVSVGDIIYIKPGEKVPLDGVVIEGYGSLDTSALTGESIPKEVNTGDEILSGCISINGLLKVEVTKEYDDSTVARILELVENASNKKAKTEKFITKFAKYYTPCVTIAAVLLAVIPPLFFGGDFNDYMIRACSFLVISCPCALVISVPLGFFGGIGRASREGILIKGSNYLETLTKVKKIVFDKTGTLTKGSFEVSKINANGVDKDELLRITAMIEASSNHPIALSIKKAYGQDVDISLTKEVIEYPGKGLSVMMDGLRYYAGNEELMKMHNISYTKASETGTVIYVASEDNYLGNIIIADKIKDDAMEAVLRLKDNHIGVVMLTGDNKKTAKDIADKLGIDQYYAGLLPGDKVTKIEELLSDTAKVAFVGDGINDAPVMTRAEIGIAMGGLRSDAAIEASDVVIMDDRLLKISKAIEIARKTMYIVKENIVIALGIKAFVLLLGAFGYVNMWMAVFADVGVSFIAILNSMRTLMYK